MYKKLLELINSAKMQKYRLKTQYTINTMKNKKTTWFIFYFYSFIFKIKIYLNIVDSPCFVRFRCRAK